MTSFPPINIRPSSESSDTHGSSGPGGGGKESKGTPGSSIHEISLRLPSVSEMQEMPLKESGYQLMGYKMQMSSEGDYEDEEVSSDDDDDSFFSDSDMRNPVETDTLEGYLARKNANISYLQSEDAFEKLDFSRLAHASMSKPTEADLNGEQFARMQRLQAVLGDVQQVVDIGDSDTQNKIKELENEIVTMATPKANNKGPTVTIGDGTETHLLSAEPSIMSRVRRPNSNIRIRDRDSVSSEVTFEPGSFQEKLDQLTRKKLELKKEMLDIQIEDLKRDAAQRAQTMVGGNVSISSKKAAWMRKVREKARHLAKQLEEDERARLQAQYEDMFAKELQLLGQSISGVEESKSGGKTMKKNSSVQSNFGIGFSSGVGSYGSKQSGTGTTKKRKVIRNQTTDQEMRARNMYRMLRESIERRIKIELERKKVNEWTMKQMMPSAIKALKMERAMQQRLKGTSTASGSQEQTSNSRRSSIALRRPSTQLSGTNSYGSSLGVEELGGYTHNNSPRMGRMRSASTVSQKSVGLEVISEFEDNLSNLMTKFEGSEDGNGNGLGSGKSVSEPNSTRASRKTSMSTKKRRKSSRPVPVSDTLRLGPLSELE